MTATRPDGLNARALGISDRQLDRRPIEARRAALVAARRTVYRAPVDFQAKRRALALIRRQAHRWTPEDEP